MNSDNVSGRNGPMNGKKNGGVGGKNDKSEVLKKNLALFNREFEKYNVGFELRKDVIIATGESFDQKSKLKQLGFKWDSRNKLWWIPSEKWKELDFSRIYLGSYKSPKAIMEKIIDYYNQIENRFLKRVVNYLIIGEKSKYGRQYFISTAAKHLHHAYKSGLAEHSLQLLESALALYDVYYYLEFDRDILIASALLHDIGKLLCYKETPGGYETTQYIEDFDHIILGISIVSRAAEHFVESEDDERKLEHLLQIITSHHNIQEWGSPKPPSSPEAWIIHTCDQLSSKIGGSFKLRMNYRRKSI